MIGYWIIRENENIDKINGFTGREVLGINGWIPEKENDPSVGAEITDLPVRKS